MEVVTGCRLHFGLIDLNGELGRVDGGVGLALERPGMVVEGEPSDVMSATGPMSERVLTSASKVVDAINGDPVQLIVKEAIPQHVGLGSGTQASLAAGKLAARLNGVMVDTHDLAEIVDRGGTSGIGTAAFDRGGFILDGGHSFSAKGQFLPSANSTLAPPPIISRLDFPDWEIVIFTPEGKGAHGSDELSIFSETCPISSRDVDRLSRVILMKLLPSVKNSNFLEFKDSVRRIQNIGFKNEEVKRQPNSREIIKKLWEEGYAAGLSSLGPSVFAIHPTNVNQSIIECPSFSTVVDTNGAKINE